LSSEPRRGADAQGSIRARHGITDTHKDQLNADLLAFLES